ncbi:MAG: helix-turn-helix domain-containing protein [Janthinobacterium lividum]
MHNPFESIANRLSTIEALLAETLPLLRGHSIAPLPETGGIELAQELTRLSKPRLYALVSARSIPHAKRGNKLYFNRAEILAWLAQGKRGN